MATQVTNYQCPACTGPLHFDSSTGKLECEYCGSSFEVAQIEALYAQKDASAEAAFDEKAAQEAAATLTDTPPVDGTTETNDTTAGETAATEGGQKSTYKKNRWDDSTISADWGEESHNMRAYNCPSCGAQLLCEATTAATHCPYCGNPSIVPGQFGGNTLKPKFIIPFKLDQKAAEDALKNYYRKKIFLPSTFSSANQIKKLQGIYVPFWLFNGKTVADCHFEGLISHTYRSGDYKVTETKHFDVQRSGDVTFCRVPTDASKKMPDDLMDSIEPFDYSGLKPFSTAYLPGYLADKYDVSVKENAQRADKRCVNTTKDLMRADVTGYQSVKDVGGKVSLTRGEVEYALLPVWILKTEWEKKTYLFAMNGQTGKIIGDLPVSKAKFWGFTLILTVILTLLFSVTGIGGVIGRMITMLLTS